MLGIAPWHARRKARLLGPYHILWNLGLTRAHRLPRREQRLGTHLCAEASYTPLSPATDSSDTAADTQATLRPGAAFAAVRKEGKTKEGKSR